MPKPVAEYLARSGEPSPVRLPLPPNGERRVISLGDSSLRVITLAEALGRLPADSRMRARFRGQPTPPSTSGQGRDMEDGDEAMDDDERVSPVPEGITSGPAMVGYAAMFMKRSEDLGGFREYIMPGAFDRCWRSADCRALVNHDPNLLMGRTTSGTLELSQDDLGLGFTIAPPDTPLARHYVEAVSRGDMTGCSFSFTVKRDEWQRGNPETDELPIRQIHEIDALFDVGPVTYPAYPDTTVAARALSRLPRPESRHIKKSVFLMRSRLALLAADNP